MGGFGIARGRRAHRAEAAEEQVGHHRREVGVAQGTTRLHPGEHPVDHAEQQHRQRLVEASACELGPGRDDRLGERGDDAALAGEHVLLSAASRNLTSSVSTRCSACAPAYSSRKAPDQRAQALLGRVRFGVDRVDERLQPRRRGLGDAHQQLHLVAVVVIERGLREAAGLGDLVHRGRRVAARGRTASAACSRIGLALSRRSRGSVRGIESDFSARRTRARRAR